MTNEEELYFKAVDDARHRVENKLNRQEIDRSQVDDLDIEIDAIMESKESFVEKINKLKLIAQN